MVEEEDKRAFLRDENCGTAQTESVVTYVEDGEVLFRKVFLGGGGYVPKNVVDNGHYQLGLGASITSQAFADRKAEPSVDREQLCPAEPKEAWTQNGNEHGVAYVLTDHVRKIDSVVLRDEKGKVIVQRYDVQVHHRPVLNEPGERDNCAHAVVCTSPDCVEKASAKRKLLEGLARIADWKILPVDVRPKQE